MKRKIGALIRLTLLIMLCVMLAASALAAAAHTHKWELSNTRKEPTCTQAGTGIYTCSICGKNETRSLPALGHSWGKWTVTKAATCTAAGSQTRTCSRCGETETKTIPATGKHSFGAWNTTRAATCLASGEESRTCSACGKTETRTVNALGHTWGLSVVTREPGLLEPGIRTYTCSRCGATAEEEIPPINEPKGGSIMNMLRNGPSDEPIEELPPAEELHIVTHPVGGTVAEGENGLELSVEAAGGYPPYTYRWRTKYNSKWFAQWNDVPGGDTNTVLATRANHMYVCDVKDAKNNRVTSDSAVLLWPMYIVQQPKNANIYGKDSVTLTCKAAGGEDYGDGTYIYAWYNEKGEQVAFSADGEGQVSEEGKYYCVVEDAGVTRLTSQTCTVYSCDPLNVTATVEKPYLVEGETTLVTMEITGGVMPYDYIWQRDGEEPFKARLEKSTLEIQVFGDGADAAAYNLTVTDAMGETASTTAWIFYDQLDIATQPEGGMLPYEGDHPLGIVMAEGEFPLKYTLYRDGEFVSEMDRDYLFMETHVTKAGVYRYHVEDATGRWADSDPAYVDDYMFDIERIDVSGDITRPGESVTLTAVTNGGAEPIEYDWSYTTLDGKTEYLSETGDTCTVSFPGNYHCKATDDDMHKATKSVTVRYTGGAPIITRQPRSLELDYSPTMSQYVNYLDCEAIAADGSKDCLTYRWESKTGKGWGDTGKDGGEAGFTYDESVRYYRCVVTDTRNGESTKSDICSIKSKLYVEITSLSGDMKKGVTIRYIVHGGTEPYWVHVCASHVKDDGQRVNGLLATDYIHDNKEHTHKVEYDQYFKTFTSHAGETFNKKGRRPDFYLTVEDVNGNIVSTDFYPGK